MDKSGTNYSKSDEVEGVSGIYFEHMQPVSVYKRDDADVQKLFKICEERCKVDFNEIVAKLETVSE